MHMATATKKWTLEELHSLPDDGNKYELVRGELRAMPPTGAEHGGLEFDLGYCLRRALEENPIGRIVGHQAFADQESEVGPEGRYLAPDSGPAEARIRLMMTKLGQLYIAIEPLRSLSREVYENGVRVETTELHRDHPQLKSTSFIMVSASERKHIAQAGNFEALLVKDGKILEGMTSNFFYVKHNVLCTAQEDILLGITRKTVIEVARGRGVAVEYEPLERNHFTDVDETFITSSSRGIVPVVQIDEATIGQGRPGPITVELSAGYDQYVIENAEII